MRRKPIEVTLYKKIGICTRCLKRTLMVFPQSFCKACSDEIEQRSQHPADIAAREKKARAKPPP